MTNATTEGPRGRWIWLGILGVAGIWLIWRLQAVILPFLLAAGVAYLVNPFIDRLGARGWSRNRSILLLLLVLLLIGAALGYLLIPQLVEETQGLITGYAALVKQAEILYEDGVWRLQRSLPRALHFERVPAQMKAKSGEYAKSLLGRAPVLLGSLLQAMAKFLIVALLTLVLSYWTLKEYHPIGRRLLAFVPSQYAATAISLSRQVNKLVSSYLLGLLTMCVIAAAIATAILLLFRVNYAFLLGLLIGAAYAIPYFGMPLALIISAIVAAVTGHSGGNILAFAICIMTLNGILDYVGTPRIIGKRVNLHPMTIIFAVVAAGELFGFLGVLIAVPLAAAVRLCLAEFFPEFFGNNSEAPTEKAAAQQKSESVSKEKGRKKKR